MNTQCFSKINRTEDIVDYVSNFEDIHDRFFWKINSTEVLQLIYHRRPVLYNEWDQLVGPLTLSNYDKLSFQFMCMKRKVRLLNSDFTQVKRTTNVRLAIWEVFQTALIMIG